MFRLVAGLAVAIAAHSQGFEVASVKIHLDQGRRARDCAIEPGRIRCLDATLGEYIMMAYSVKRYQISGPSWIVSQSSSRTYDIVANVGTAVPQAGVKLRLGPLLLERFHLTFHRETRELPVFALTVDRNGPKFKEPGSGGEKRISPDGNGGIAFEHWTMEDLADWLTVLPSMSQPVVNQTGLPGSFSFDANLFGLDKGISDGDLKRAMIAMDAPGTLRATLPEQLGLRLEARKTTMEMIVIDSAEKTPTEN